MHRFAAKNRLFMQVSFFVRSAKNKKYATVYAHITVNKIRTKTPFSTFIKVPLKNWCVKTKRIKGKDFFVENEKLREIEINLKEIYFTLYRNNTSVTSELVKNEFLKEEKTLLLLEAYEYAIDKKKQNKQNFYNLVCQKNVLSNFLTSEKKQNMAACSVDVKFVRAFEGWLLALHLKQSTVNSYLSGLRLVLGLAFKNELIEVHPLSSLKIKPTKTKEIVFLDEKEFQDFINFVPSCPKMQLTKDVFLCLCFTGFSISDLRNFDFNRDTFVEGGAVWITIQRKKTGVSAVLPVFDELNEILKKYNYRLPVPSAAALTVFNSNLKKIASLLGISKILSSHTGRKTFANRWLNRAGVSSDVVASMLGHDVGMLNKYYAKVNRSKIRNEVLNLQI